MVGDEVRELVRGLRAGQLLLLENVRYEPGETKNDPELAASLAALADVYVDDAFGAAHRAHASTEGVAHLVADRAAGLLLEREVSELSKLLDDPARPLAVVLGGAKVSDKIAVIDRFLQLADTILIALASAERASAELLLPVDLIVADRFAADAEVRAIDGLEVPPGWLGLDIGRRTADRYAAVIERAGTVFWNGPMGAFELPFAAGTRVVAEAVAAATETTVVGGGDSLSALRSFGLTGKVTHASTGGGASLELIEGKKLPGVEVLREAVTREPALAAEVAD